MREVNVFKGANFIGTFPSIKMASEILNVDASDISKVLNGKRNHTGGYFFSEPEERYTYEEWQAIEEAEFDELELEIKELELELNELESEIEEFVLEFEDEIAELQ